MDNDTTTPPVPARDRYHWEHHVLASDLPPRARLLCLVLATFTSRGTVRVWPTAQTLGTAMGTSESSARRGIRALRDAGWVAVESGNSARANRYTLTIPATEAGADPATSGRVGQGDPATSDRVTLSPVTADPATSGRPPDQEQTTEQTTTTAAPVAQLDGEPVEPEGVEEVADWSAEVQAAAAAVSGALDEVTRERLRDEEDHAPAAVVRLLDAIDQATRAGWSAEGLAEVTTATGLGTADSVAAVLAKRVRDLGDAQGDPARERVAARERAEREAEAEQQRQRDEREAEAAAWEERTADVRQQWQAMDAGEQRDAVRALVQVEPGLAIVLRLGDPTGPLVEPQVLSAAAEHGWQHDREAVA